MPALFTHVDHDHPAQNTHLRRGQTRAVGLVHGVGHVLQETVELFIYTGYGLGYLAQYRIAGHQNIQ